MARRLHSQEANIDINLSRGYLGSTAVLDSLAKAEIFNPVG
jgi:hypothetical protein